MKTNAYVLTPSKTGRKASFALGCFNIAIMQLEGLAPVCEVAYNAEMRERLSTKAHELGMHFVIKLPGRLPYVRLASARKTNELRQRAIMELRRLLGFKEPDNEVLKQLSSAAAQALCRVVRVGTFYSVPLEHSSWE